ncbi:unnamed protein product [Closterium sp. Yama58-4]|nr:unnamed protein product [Closterium sp. Yama58-4]
MARLLFVVSFAVLLAVASAGQTVVTGPNNPAVNLDQAKGDNGVATVVPPGIEKAAAAGKLDNFEGTTIVSPSTDSMLMVDVKQAGWNKMKCHKDLGKPGDGACTPANCSKGGIPAKWKTSNLLKNKLGVEVYVKGNPLTLKKASPQTCCNTCAGFSSCTYWQYIPDITIDGKKTEGACYLVHDNIDYTCGELTAQYATDSKPIALQHMHTSSPAYKVYVVGSWLAGPFHTGAGLGARLDILRDGCPSVADIRRRLYAQLPLDHAARWIHVLPAPPPFLPDLSHDFLREQPRLQRDVLYRFYTRALPSGSRFNFAADRGICSLCLAAPTETISHIFYECGVAPAVISALSSVARRHIHCSPPPELLLFPLASRAGQVAPWSLLVGASTKAIWNARCEHKFQDSPPSRFEILQLILANADEVSAEPSAPSADAKAEPDREIVAGNTAAEDTGKKAEDAEKKAEDEGKKAQKRGKELEKRLRRLREVMAEVDGGKGVDAFIIPSEDPHQSEYMAPCFERRAFISGFTGSAGTAVVTRERALLWTDGRYFLQAEQQLPPAWDLMRAGMPGVPSVADWLAEALPAGSRVGVDPFVHSADNVRGLADTLAASSSVVVPLLRESNPVDVVWGAERPPPPSAPMRVHPIEFAGRTVRAKLQQLRAEMREAGATALLVSALDEVAWLLNVRGADVPHCPVTVAYAVVETEAAHLFVDPSKVAAPAVAEHLAAAGVTVKPYGDLVPFLQRSAMDGARLWLDPASASSAVLCSVEAACAQFYEQRASGKGGFGGKKGKKGEKGEKKSKEGKGGKGREERGGGGGEEVEGPAVLSHTTPISLAKALKNESEIEGMKNAHIRDAVAMAHFWEWAERAVVEEGRAVTEVELGERLEAFRAQQDGFLDTSFDTIAGSGKNGAIIHYRAEEGSCAVVDPSRMLLLDSGAQYVDGTTDITRTVHFGTPSDYEKECYTRVLQGHIALDQAVFPQGTPGFALDILARKALWGMGLDYRHGTGHGVGAALNVHEGPQSISPRFGNATPLQAGMVVSNEPGFYHDNQFGIRIENLLVVREQETQFRFGGTTYLGFECLTLFPVQTKLVSVELLSEAEIEWINDYHQRVWDTVSPLLSGAPLEWLQRNTRPISHAQAVPKPAAGKGAAKGAKAGAKAAAKAAAAS